MAFQFLSPDPVEAELGAVFEQLDRGISVDKIERRTVDLKEEAGRRDGRNVLPGQSTNERAAIKLAPEVACMANTSGGGVLVLGVGNDGTPIGTELEAEWLRHRLWELADSQITVDVRVANWEGVRLLVLRIPEALQPVRHKNRLLWRVDDHCVEVDVASWWSGRLTRLGHDWSAEASTHPVSAATAVAIARARQFLRDSNEDRAQELATVSDENLLRRLNVATHEDMLTNAGALLFIGRGEPALDYIRRQVSGGDSTLRIREAKRSLLEEIYDVQQAVSLANAMVHTTVGLVTGQLREIPPRAVREALVNGVVHRDWLSPEPTTVEHVGATLVVTSPGGFVGGVTPENIITHPSAPRYRALAEVVAALRIAECEGIGVDRMTADMLRLGYRAPHIEQQDGPMVRAALVGGRVDEDWLRFLRSLRPETLADDLDALLVLRHLVEHGWVDAFTAAPVLQRPAAEALGVLERLADASVAGDREFIAGLLVQVRGAPVSDPPAWRFADGVRASLGSRLAGLLAPPNRKHVALQWATARGRASTTELGDVLGVATSVAGGVLRSLEADGLLAPSRGNRRGRSFHYILADRDARG